MRLKLVSANHPALVSTAERVHPHEIVSGDYKDLVDSMVRFSKGEQDDDSKLVMVGLAAPQIGISKRIVLVDLTYVSDVHGSRGGLNAYFNPELTWTSVEGSEYREGCFSTDRVAGIVSRRDEIRVKFHDKNGHLREEHFKGYTARIFQHEIDHLDGIFFIDRITDDEKLHWVEQNQIQQYRQEWQNWRFKCPRERWDGIKTSPDRY